MAALIAVAIIMITLTGIMLGAFLALCLAIARDDRQKWSLRFDAPTSSTRTARKFVGIGAR